MLNVLPLGSRMGSRKFRMTANDWERLWAKGTWVSNRNYFEEPLLGSLGHPSSPIWSGWFSPGPRRAIEREARFQMSHWPGSHTQGFQQSETCSAGLCCTLLPCRYFNLHSFSWTMEERKKGWGNSSFFFFFCLAKPHGLWDLSFPSRDQSQAPCTESAEA